MEKIQQIDSIIQILQKNLKEANQKNKLLFSGIVEEERENIAFFLKLRQQIKGGP